MDENSQDAPLGNEEVKNLKVGRRELLPWWIKTFAWLFMIMGAFVPIGVILGLMGYNVSISLYGISTIVPFSITGLILIVLYSIKAAASFGLWTEKKWAVDLGIFDAVLGLIVCVVGMLVLPFIDSSEEFTLNIRLEPLLLILYFLKLQKIKPLWKAE